MVTIIDGGFFPSGGIATFESRKNGQSVMETRRGALNIDGTFNRPLDPFQPAGMDYTPDDSLVERTPIKVNVFDPAVEPVSDGTVTEKNIQTQTEIMQDRQKAQAALAGARFFADVMNAQSQYNAISEQARTNIFLANQSAADAISRGKQAGLAYEQQGRNQGEMAKIAAAAQGQDVQGEGVGKIVSSQEAVGVYNAMIAEMNASREALGFEQEAIQYMGQIEQARIQRNYSILSSALSFGATAYSLG